MSRSGPPTPSPGKVRSEPVDRRLEQTAHARTHHLDWYDIKAPSIFDTRNAGKTFTNRSAGMSASRLPACLFSLS